MWQKGGGFLPTIHMLTHHIKKKKNYASCHTRPMLQKREKSHDAARKKREKKKEEEGRNPPSRPANSRQPTSAGSRRPWVCETQVFFAKGFASAGGGGVVFRFESRFFSIGSGCRKDLAVALSHLAASRRQATETHGWVSPAVGLGFFFFFPSGGLIFVLFLG
jgi:hypothetical protein